MPYLEFSNSCLILVFLNFRLAEECSAWCTIKMSFSRDQAIHKERHIRIICIGAGASGLLFAYKLQRSFQNFELTVSRALSSLLSPNTCSVPRIH